MLSQLEYAFKLDEVSNFFSFFKQHNAFPNDLT